MKAIDIEAAQSALESIMRLEKAGRMKEAMEILNRSKRLHIPTTSPVSRLNAALAEADRLSGYALDTSDPWELVGWLLQRDRLDLAFELHAAARAAKCWEETSVDRM